LQTELERKLLKIPTNFTQHSFDSSYFRIHLNKDKGHHKPEAVNHSIIHARHSFPSHEGWMVFEKHALTRKMVEIINQNNNDFDELMLIASPKVLGDLRIHLNKHSLEKIVEEIHKDYTHSPIKEIESIF
jgi:protein required for attachment to host cells